MRWEEFREKYSKTLYKRTKSLCDKIHEEVKDQDNIKSLLCETCYKRNGKICFPCNYIKNAYEKRWKQPLEDKMGS